MRLLWKMLKMVIWVMKRDDLRISILGKTRRLFSSSRTKMIRLIFGLMLLWVMICICVYC